MEKLSAGGSSGFDDQWEFRPDAELLPPDLYHFSEKPFKNNPDPKFLYLTRSYQEIFASILTWIKEGNGFAVITGEAGTGKTFFIHALVSSLDEKVIPVLVQNPVSTFKELLETILLVLKLPADEKSETALFHGFTRFLDQMMAQDNILLIILDEAQGFKDHILYGIERFLDLRSKRIRTILVGQPHFEERLNSASLGSFRRKIEIKQKIRPFNEEESRGYIDHRLNLVGSSSEIMTPKAVSMICSYAQGISSLINHACDNALWVGHSMNRKKIDADIVEKVVRNLEGIRMITHTIPWNQLKRIWKPAIRFALSLKNASMASFFKMIRNFEGPRMIPQAIPLIHPGRIWKRAVQFFISSKIASMALPVKVRQNLQRLRCKPRVLPSIQIGDVFKFPIQFALSSKRGFLVIFLKLRHNLPRPPIIPKTLPSIQLTRIWKPNIQFTISLKRVGMAILLKCMRNGERARNIPKAFPSIQFGQIWKTSIQFAISLKNISAAIFLLACMGGLIFLLYEFIGWGPVKIQVTKSLPRQTLVIDPSAHKPSAEGISQKKGIPKSDVLKLTRPQSSSPQKDTAPLRHRKGKQKQAEVVADKRSNQVFSLKKKESPPLESSFSARGGAPKLMDEISKASKTQALTITHFFAAQKGPYGCVWQIYIEAEDPDGDMDRIAVEVNQVNYGHYPTEWIMIRPPHRKHLTGFIQWNTFSSKTSYLPEGTEISVKLSIFDQAGNKSNEVIIPFTFRSGAMKRYQLPAPFDKGNIPRIGYVMLELC